MSRAIMQLVSGGHRSGRGKTHARDARAQAIQSRGPVGILSDVHRLDDQADALFFFELQLVDPYLQHVACGHAFRPNDGTKHGLWRWRLADDDVRRLARAQALRFFQAARFDG